MGTLVLLENLDPSFAAQEVEELVRHAFNQKVEARLIPVHTFSSPLYGSAFAIFESKEAAEYVIFESNRRCLMLADGRPAICCRGILIEPDNSARFAGHIAIDKIRI